MKKHKQMTVKISELKGLEKNARQHSDAQIQQIMESIKTFGFLTPIVIDKKKEVFAGNGRLEAAKRLGIEEVPAILADGLTREELRAYALVDNRLSETSSWSLDVLKEELDDLMLNIGLDLTAVGFSPGEIDTLLKVPQIPSIRSGKELDESDFSEFDCKCPRCGFEFDK